MKSFSLRMPSAGLRRYDAPAVMGILNVTADSFYSGSRAMTDADISARAAMLAAQGADFIDVGAYSTRPGAADVPEAEEMARLRRALPLVRAAAPGVPVSVDTFRAAVARVTVEELGADIINDVSGGLLDPAMHATVAALHVPYILGHMRGTPADMQSHTDYRDVTADVIAELGALFRDLSLRGAADVIIDPCFGFSKTLEQNYTLMRDLPLLEDVFHSPVLAGVSRKSMITRLLGITADDAMNGTTALNTLALDRGAAILRVHDVAAARQAVTVYKAVASV